MAQLLVRNIPDSLVQMLKDRASKHGRSAEAEHRVLLEKALKPSWDEFRKKAAELRRQTRGRVTCTRGGRG